MAQAARERLSGGRSGAQSSYGDEEQHGGDSPAPSASTLAPPLLAAYLGQQEMERVASAIRGGAPGALAAGASAAGGEEGNHPAAAMMRALQAAAVAGAGVDASGLHVTARTYRFDLSGRLCSLGSGDRGARTRPSKAPAAPLAFDASGTDFDADSALASMALGDEGSGQQEAHAHGEEGGCGCTGAAGCAHSHAHHHNGADQDHDGEEADEDTDPGMPLSDLCGMLRSRVSGQRALAGRALTGLLRRRRAAMLGRPSPPDDSASHDQDGSGSGSIDWASVEAPALRALSLPPVLPVLLRAAADDTAAASLRWALSALAAFLCPLQDEEGSAGCAGAGGTSVATGTEAVAREVSLLAHPPPPLVTAQPPSVLELSSIEGQGAVPLAQRSCDPAGRLLSRPGPGADASAPRSASASASEGLDCLVDPLTVMASRMGLVERLALVLAEAVAPLVPQRPGRPEAHPASRLPPAAVVLPCLEVLTCIAARSAACAEAVASARTILPLGLPGAQGPGSPSSGGGAGGGGVPLLPLLVDTLLCTDTVVSAVRRHVGGLARGDPQRCSSASDAEERGAVALAASVMRLLQALVRSSRVVAAALCDSDDGIEGARATESVSQQSTQRAWPGRVTLESLVQFLPLAAGAPANAGSNSSGGGGGSDEEGLPVLTAQHVAPATLGLCWGALRLLQSCLRYGFGSDLLPVLYAPSLAATHSQGHGGEGGSGSAHGAPMSLPGLRVWIDSLPDACKEAALEDEGSDGFTAAPLADAHWRLLFGCGTAAVLEAAASLAVSEAWGGNGASERAAAASSPARDAPGSSSSAGVSSQSLDDVVGDVILLSSQVQAAAGHAVGMIHEVLPSQGAAGSSAPPPGPALVASASLLALLSAFLARPSLPQQLIGEAFPTVMRRALENSPGIASGPGAARVARLSAFYLPSPVQLALDAHAVGGAEGSPAGASASVGAAIAGHLGEILLAPLLFSQGGAAGAAHCVAAAIAANGAPLTAVHCCWSEAALGLLATLLQQWPGVTRSRIEPACPAAALDASLRSLSGSLQAHLAGTLPPALANAGTALPLSLAQHAMGAFMQEASLELALPVSCAPAAHALARSSAVAALSSTLSVLTTVASGSSTSQQDTASLSSAWEAVLLHCLPGSEPQAVRALRQVAGPAGAVASHCLGLSGGGEGASRDPADTHSLLPPYPQWAALAPCFPHLPSVLASVPAGLPAHPQWRALALQASLASAGGYSSLRSATAKRADGQAEHEDGAEDAADEAYGDLLAALRLLASAGQHSGAPPSSSAVPPAVDLLHALDSAFQLLHTGLLPAPVPGELVSALVAALEATFTSVRAACERSSGSVLPVVSLLAKHPRYGFRAASSSSSSSGGHGGEEDGMGPDSSSEGTLLHALVDGLVGAMAESADVSAAAALCLGALLQQAPGDIRAAALRLAVWSGLDRAGVAGRVALPLAPPPLRGPAPADGSGALSLAAAMAFPPEEDAGVLDVMVSLLPAAAQEEGDADEVDGGAAGDSAATGGATWRLADLATRHVALLVFGDLSSPPPPRLGFAACEAVRKLAEAGQRGREALRRLAAHASALAQAAGVDASREAYDQLVGAALRQMGLGEQS